MKKVYTALLLGLSFALLPVARLIAQSAISGTVTSAGTGEALPGVSIVVSGSTNGTTTGTDGRYTLHVPVNARLVFSYVGFDPREMPVDNRTTIDVALTESEKSLTEVVVVGYTSQSKVKTTAAVSKLGTEELRNTSNPNPVQAMQGKMAGVSIPVNSGQPGAGATNIVIRGGTKLNVYGTGLGNSGGNSVGSSESTGPLVIVDGVFRSLNDINPDNIESFQVMKDAAATAIYGARGANGVIVVKTKGGKFNTKANITLNHRTTWETNSRDYKYLNARDYLALARKTVQGTFDPIDKNNLLNNGGFSAGTRIYTAPGQYGNNINLTALYDNIVAVEGQGYVDNLIAKGWQTMDDPINPGTRLLFADNHYQDMLWNTGVTQNHNLSIDGGSERASYNVAAGYTNQAGTFAGTRYKRYDVLGNFGFKASDRLRIDAMVNYQNVLPNYVEAFQNELTRGTRLTPLIRIYKDDGNPTPGENYATRNRFHTLKYDDVRAATERIISRVAGDLQIAKGLSYKPAFSYLMQDYRYMLMRKATPASEIQPATQRQKNEDTNNFRQLMIDQILQYDLNLHELHSFTFLAGFNFTKSTNSIVNIGSQRATNDYIYTINEPTTSVINGVVNTNVTDFRTTLSENRSASYFGQLNYDYDSRYLVSAALRYDGFSNFAPQNKYALFPSASVGWNIHREKFWNFTPVSMLKLRGSWGQAGSSDLSLTDTYGGYSGQTYALGSGILRANLSNPNLKWELTETTDLALDAALFGDRVTMSVDFYNKLTKNRLESKPLPSEAPFASITYNNGTLQNKGVEIELGATVIKAGAFTWRSNFSFALNRTIIKKLPDNGRAKNRQGGDLVYDPAAGKNVEAGGLAEGERPFGLYAYKVLGVFSTEEEAKTWNATKKDNLASPSGITTGKHAGDFIFDDINNDGVIDTKDQVFMGYRNPDKIGGMQNTFSYKSLSLRVAVDYALGHVISDGALARSLGTGRAFNEGAPSQAVGPDIWQKSGDTGKKYARFSFADADFGQRNYLRSATLGNNNGYGSDVSVMIEKGNFLALREISLAYDLPKTLLKKIGSTGMNVFVSVYNLGYVTRYKGINPETYTGFDAAGYPRPRQFSVGTTLRF
nr:SusC/RagA family TonB-linked outer membrane protein [uncultured Dyadobacter sp.]